MLPKSSAIIVCFRFFNYTFIIHNLGKIDTMKIISWNVNGIRAIMKKNFLDFLLTEKPDVLCVQEVKISESSKNDAQLDFPSYKEYWNCAKRPGYSGTAILVREG